MIPIEHVKLLYNQFPEDKRDLTFEQFNKEVQSLADPKTQMSTCRAMMLDIHKGKVNKMKIDSVIQQGNNG